MNASDEHGDTPLTYAAAAAQNSAETVLKLIEAGANVGTRNHHGDDALHFAQLHKNVESAELIKGAEGIRLAMAIKKMHLR